MTGDFTYGAYADLIDAILDSGYDTLTVREYVGSDDLPERFVVLRHDVDRKPGNALDLARIEAARDVRSTHYVRTIEKTFRPKIVRAIEDLGHEIGYHYEDMDRTKGHVGSARDSFEHHLRRLRDHATVDTICMHGNPLTSYDNRDLWTDGEFESYGVRGEAYLSVDFTDLTYFSDTGRTWRDGLLKVKDHPVGENGKDVQVDTTPELIELIRAGEVPRLYVLTHPNRWADGVVELAVETTKDLATNAGKYALQTLSSG